MSTPKWNNSAKTFPGRLKQLRGNASQAEFAKKFGVSQVTWGRWELGQREPDLEVITKICKTEMVSSDWLLGLSDVREIATPHLQSGEKGDDFVMRMAKEAAARAAEEAAKAQMAEKGTAPLDLSSIVETNFELGDDGSLVTRHVLLQPDGTKKVLEFSTPPAPPSPKKPSLTDADIRRLLSQMKRDRSQSPNPSRAPV